MARFFRRSIPPTATRILSSSDGLESIQPVVHRQWGGRIHTAAGFLINHGNIATDNFALLLHKDNAINPDQPELKRSAADMPALV